jgi:methionyl-tRNA formyltransferase
VPALELLSQDPQYNIKLVITGIIEASGRKKDKIVNPVEELAKEKKIPILKTTKINDPFIIDKIRKTHATLGIMADFGQIVSKEILEIPKFGIINIHPSLLPQHRGPSPIQQTILDGNKETGVTLILAGEKMDAGDILASIVVKLRGTETTTILKDYLAQIGANLLLNSIPYYLSGDLTPVAQDDNKATYNSLFKKEDGFVDKNTKKIEIGRKIRAFSEWPKVYTISKGKRVQLIASHFDQEGNFILDVVKPEGKKEMSYADFVRGYRAEIDI